MTSQRSISESPKSAPAALVEGCTPVYRTSFGATFNGDARDVLARLPTDSANLVITSPPYALHFKKEYGNANKSDYVAWFRPFAEQILRILRPDGSFVLNIGGSYNSGSPTRSLKRLMKNGFRPKKRPSGHVITPKFGRDRGGAIPSNVIERGNNESNSTTSAPARPLDTSRTLLAFRARCQSSSSSFLPIPQTLSSTLSPEAI